MNKYTVNNLGLWSTGMRNKSDLENDTGQHSTKKKKERNKSTLIFSSLLKIKILYWH